MSAQHPTSLRTNMTTTPLILMIREGQDYLLEEDIQLPYKLVKNLGHGHSANVEMVEDINTGSVFAHKVFPIYGSRTEARRIFDNEIKIIRRLAPHHHIIRIFATYVAKREVGLILHPVADSGDLYTFLQDFKEAKATHLMQPERTRVLESSFGCLASGLAFMHHQKIRHKDIKPQNILVHRGSLIYTDFGYSLDHSANIGSTTTGAPNAFTRKYCAPEVSDHGPRNSKSDIYSLGCIFLDILFALHKELISPDPRKCYQEILEDSQLQSSLQGLNLFGMIASDMLLPQPNERPSAEDITFRLEKYEPQSFCTQCIVHVRLKPQQILDVPVPPSFTGPLSPGSIPSDQRTFPHLSDNPTNVLEKHERGYGFLHSYPDSDPDSDPSFGKWILQFSANSNIDHIARSHSEASWSTPNYRNQIPNYNSIPRAPIPRPSISRPSIPRASIPRINNGRHKHYTCIILNCVWNGKCFTSFNKFVLHRKSVHKIGTSYKCASEFCRNREKIWPHYDNFEKHIHRMHSEEDEEELIRRSVHPLAETSTANMPSMASGDNDLISTGAERLFSHDAHNAPIDQAWC